MNAWGALTTVLCVLTVVAGLVFLITLAILAALRAHLTNLNFHAWRIQLESPRQREYVESTSRR